MGRHQSRSHAQRQVEAEVDRRPDHRRRHRRRDLRHGVRDRGIAEAERAHLGRQRRRPRPRHDRRRQELEERHRRDARLPRVGHRQHDRAVAVRRQHRLRRRRRAPPRQHASVPLQDDGPRARPGNGSTARSPQNVYLHAVREDPKKRGQLYLGTERGVMFSPDDWADVAAAAAQHADRGGARPASSRTTTWSSPRTDGRCGSSTTCSRSASTRERSPPSRCICSRRRDATRWRYGSSNWGTRGSFPNPPHGAAIYYCAEGRGKGRPEDRDPRQPESGRADAEQHGRPNRWAATTTRIRTTSRRQALPRDAGVQRAVWDLRYEGARKIKNGAHRYRRSAQRPARRRPGPTPSR